MHEREQVRLMLTVVMGRLSQRFRIRAIKYSQANMQIVGLLMEWMNVMDVM